MNTPIDPSVPCGSYSRFSTDLQSEESNADQQRKCCEKAATNGHRISPELEFADEAVSGTKRHRAGLDAMLAAAEAGRIKVLYFFSLSRLSRESVITLPLLKHLVYNCGVRIISVTEGIDSNVTSWELIAHIMAIVHEQYLKDLAANVLRGQEGAVLAGWSVGDYCFGYASEPIPGSEKGRRGRNAKPRKLYIINPLTATWVARIFHWFVHEGRSLRWIARELNRLGAPKDHRASKKNWRHQYLPRLLRNVKYIGLWPWKQKMNVRDPLTGNRHQEDHPPEETEKWLRHFPHLRLIDDETFEQAQRLLQKNDEVYGAVRKKKGKLAGSSREASRRHPRHLLQGLLVCKECESTLSVGGSGAEYFFCPGYVMGICSCKTQLPRALARTMVLDEIGRRVLANPAWRQIALDELAKSWASREAEQPGDLAAAEKALAEVKQFIKNLVDQTEKGNAPPELSERLAQRRLEKQEWTETVERLRRTMENRRPAPTEAWVDAKLARLDETLSGETPAAAHALRDLVGGQIILTEIRRPGHERHYWQGRFTIRTSAIVQVLSGTNDQSPQPVTTDPNLPGEEVVIDFRQPPQYEVESERAKELFDQDWLMIRIAQEMGRKKSYVRKLIKHWFESRGLPVPDGRARRSSLTQKHLVPPTFEALADPVLALLEEDLLIEEIAARLDVCRDTITKVIKYLRAVRGLDIPDGRTRRKSLDHKVSRPNGSDAPRDDNPPAA
jgi:DNA invertase Pin-like site-specific DNA recombinase